MPLEVTPQNCSLKFVDVLPRIAKRVHYNSDHFIVNPSSPNLWFERRSLIIEFQHGDACALTMSFNPTDRRLGTVIWQYNMVHTPVRTRVGFITSTTTSTYVVGRLAFEHPLNGLCHTTIPGGTWRLWFAMSLHKLGISATVIKHSMGVEWPPSTAGGCGPCVSESGVLPHTGTTSSRAGVVPVRRGKRGDV